MRRASTCLAVLGLAALSLPAAAAAAPTVTFKATAIPIPGFKGTGNILGAGAAVKAEWTMKGSEYDEGHPAPLIGVNLTLPSGTKLHPQGFPTCTHSAILELGENVVKSRCTTKSLLTFPVLTRQPEEAESVLANESYALGVVRFGKSVVPEKSRILGFFSPGGGYEFLSKGVSPASFEIYSKSHVVSSKAPQIVTAVPLVETVKGAAYASVEKIVVYSGSAIKKGKSTTYYGTMPKTCPKGGYPIKSELIFANTAQLPAEAGENQSVAPGERVTTVYKAPCPRK